MLPAVIFNSRSMSVTCLAVSFFTSLSAAFRIFDFGVLTRVKSGLNFIFLPTTLQRTQSETILEVSLFLPLLWRTVDIFIVEVVHII
jgi:hypothetical protein